ncbi:hypothetical protein QNH10_00630 [Sporosarcina thermotolerans]|nr:hypothetical protein [Sporosarcina thermotolerans]WHT48402.1 hypothetical protein QNH10_00630 [Sporosarcina thermotolerans]
MRTSPAKTIERVKERLGMESLDRSIPYEQLEEKFIEEPSVGKRNIPGAAPASTKIVK